MRVPPINLRQGAAQGDTIVRVEEGGHRSGEVPQRLLLHHLRARAQPVMVCAGGGELAALLQVARRALAALMPVRVLLDGEVPYIPGVRAVAAQQRLLAERGKQPEPGHANTLARTTDVSEEVKRRFLPGLKAGDRWCLCAARWQEAFEAGMAPKVVLSATHERALEIVSLKDLKRFAIDLS